MDEAPPPPQHTHTPACFPAAPWGGGGWRSTATASDHCPHTMEAPHGLRAVVAHQSPPWVEVGRGGAAGKAALPITLGTAALEAALVDFDTIKPVSQHPHLGCSRPQSSHRLRAGTRKHFRTRHKMSLWNSPSQDEGLTGWAEGECRAGLPGVGLPSNFPQGLLTLIRAWTPLPRCEMET